jgi:hypothetical protein
MIHGLETLTGPPVDQTTYKETLAQIDALKGKYHVQAVRAWDYVEGYPIRQHFCLELERPPLPGTKGKVLMQGGKPVIMGNQQIKFLVEMLNRRKPWPPEKDIFRHLHEFGVQKRVQIVGPGPNGKEHWHELDKDCFTILVNKACDIPDVQDIGHDHMIWITSEGTAHLTHWFKWGLEHMYDIACMSHSDLSKFYPECPWTHELGGMMGRGDVRPTPLLLRGGATITSMAVHLAYWLGAKEIVLCGVDMGPNQYYDYNPDADKGTKEHEVAEYKAGMYKDFSKYVPLMQELCDWMHMNGIRVGTLSPTALLVEDVKTW